MQFVIN